MESNFKVKKNSNFLEYYRYILAVPVIYIWFTGLDTYYLKSGVGVLPKLYLFGFAFACVPLIPSFLTNFTNLHRSRWFLFWCGGYTVISATYFLLAPVHSTEVAQELETRILGVGVMIVALIIFSNSSSVQKLAQWLILIVTLVAVANNFYELLNPLSFAGLNISGRPAGYYIDANSSGFGITLGLIFTINLIPQKYRLLYFSLVSSGVIITFSRGSILTLIIVAAVLLWDKTLPRRQFIFFIIGVIVLFLFLGSYNFIYQQLTALESKGLINDNIFSRVIWFLDSSSYGANTDNSRVDIINYALQEFAKNPIWGRGLGFTRTWTGIVRPHNMYVVFMVEHGFLGFLFMPLLIWAVIQNARQETKTIALSFAVLLILRCIFSQNVLEERYSLIAFPLMTVFSTTSFNNWLKQKKVNQSQLLDY